MSEAHRILPLAKLDARSGGRARARPAARLAARAGPVARGAPIEQLVADCPDESRHLLDAILDSAPPIPWLRASQLQRGSLVSILETESIKIKWKTKLQMMIDAALGKLGVERAIFVVHSWSGALGARLALDHASRVAGLVMLAPVTHPWRGGVGRYNEIIATPVIGPLLAYTITLPLGYFVAESGARSVFLPQTMPDGFVKESATPLLLRPREFIANAHDLVTLKASVAAQAPRYGEIGAPVTVIAGEPDKTVKTDIHARPFAATVPNAKLIVLPDLGHMVQNAVPELVKTEIEAMVGRIVPAQAAAD